MTHDSNLLFVSKHLSVSVFIGSDKTILSRHLRAELEREGWVIVSRSLTVEKAKITDIGPITEDGANYLPPPKPRRLRRGGSAGPRTIAGRKGS